MSVIVQVFSDYVCPYSYLVEVLLRKAVSETGAEVVWRAHQLSQAGEPLPDPGSMRMLEIWGNTVLPLAQRLGVEIRIPSQLSSTRLAHEAAAWARARGAFSPFHQRLFRAYFLDGADIGDPGVLGDIAWQAGLNRTELEGILAGQSMADEVDEDLLIGRTYGVPGTPTLVIGGHLISGLQETEALIRAISNAGEGEFQAGPRSTPHLPIVQVESKK